MTKEQMATLPMDALRRHLESLQALKRGNAKRLGWMSTEGGKAFLEEKKAQLQRVREEYPAIVVNDQRTAEAILRELVAVQCKDRIIAEEIARLEQPEQFDKKVDAELLVCHAVIAEKADDARGER